MKNTPEITVSMGRTGPRTITPLPALLGVVLSVGGVKKICGLGLFFLFVLDACILTLGWA